MKKHISECRTAPGASVIVFLPCQTEADSLFPKKTAQSVIVFRRPGAFFCIALLYAKKRKSKYSFYNIIYCLFKERCRIDWKNSFWNALYAELRELFYGFMIDPARNFYFRIILFCRILPYQRHHFFRIRKIHIVKHYYVGFRFKRVFYLFIETNIFYLQASEIIILFHKMRRHISKNIKDYLKLGFTSSQKPPSAQKTVLRLW